MFISFRNEDWHWTFSKSACCFTKKMNQIRSFPEAEYRTKETFKFSVSPKVVLWSVKKMKFKTLVRNLMEHFVILKLYLKIMKPNSELISTFSFMPCISFIIVLNSYIKARMYYFSNPGTTINWIHYLWCIICVASMRKVGLDWNKWIWTPWISVESLNSTLFERLLTPRYL